MAKYIEREELVEWIKRIPLKDLSDGLGLCRVIMEEDFKRAIRTIPAGTIIDVAPVRHGRWERIGIKCRKGLTIYPCCSACGTVSAAFRSEWEGLRGQWKYCPNCGCRMDGGDDE